MHSSACESSDTEQELTKSVTRLSLSAVECLSGSTHLALARIVLLDGKFCSSPRAELEMKSIMHRCQELDTSTAAAFDSTLRTWCCLLTLKLLRKNSYFQLQSPLNAAARIYPDTNILKHA